MAQTPYQFRNENSSFEAQPLEDAPPGCRQVIITIRENGYGSYQEGEGIRLPSNVLFRDSASKVFEYYNPDSETYHRIPLQQIGNALIDGEWVQLTEPEALAVRHSAWIGKDEAEIRAELMARRNRQRQREVENALALVKFEVARRKREADEAAIREMLEKEIAGEPQPSLEEMLHAQMTSEEFAIWQEMN